LLRSSWLPPFGCGTDATNPGDNARARKKALKASGFSTCGASPLRSAMEVNEGWSGL